ncbi:MAG: thioredoxin domain-containing protein [Actinobacteria bacterium]|nr:thioredoxin domain-containing protein [Actinomycetota bacterium]
MPTATRPPEQPEVPQRPMPRRGRAWVVLVLALGLFALGYALVNIATQKPNKNTVHIEGVETAQRLFGGVPQEGARLGSENAPVTVQVFADEQSSLCREGFLSTIPELTEKYARPGSVKFLYRHYSNSENEIEYGFYGTEAAAEQGYGWQYVYLFFENQEEADRFGVSEAENRRSGLRQNFLDSVAGGVEELEENEWEEAFEKGKIEGSAMEKSLRAQEELGSKLGIRYGLAMVIEGPKGNETLQENPTLKEVEAAIEKVS